MSDPSQEFRKEAIADLEKLRRDEMERHEANLRRLSERHVEKLARLERDRDAVLRELDAKHRQLRQRLARLFGRGPDPRQEIEDVRAGIEAAQAAEISAFEQARDRLNSDDQKSRLRHFQEIKTLQESRGRKHRPETAENREQIDREREEARKLQREQQRQRRRRERD